MSYKEDGRLSQEGPPQAEPEAFNYYAWGRLGRMLIGGHMDEIFAKTSFDTPFVYLDGCSSTPWLREVMRGQFGREVGLGQTRDVLAGLETAFKHRDSEVLGGTIAKLRQEKMNEVRGILFTRGKLPRQILEAAIFNLVFEPDTTGVDTSNEDEIKAYFLDRLRTFPSAYLTIVQENGSGKGSWESLMIDEAPVSFSDIIHSGSLSDDEAEKVLNRTAGYFASQLVSNIRPSSRFVSLDLTSIDVFRRAAYRNFPIDVLKTQFFRNVLDPQRHVTGDIRHLAHFGDESVSAYSMIEGFPFYAEYFSDEDATQVLSEAWRVLRMGGKFMAFPWIARDGRDLAGFEAGLADLGFDVEIEDRTRGELLDGMNPRELALVKKSPVFTDSLGNLPFLVATKKAASLSH